MIKITGLNASDFSKGIIQLGLLNAFLVILSAQAVFAQVDSTSFHLQFKTINQAQIKELGNITLENWKKEYPNLEYRKTFRIQDSVLQRFFTISFKSINEAKRFFYEKHSAGSIKSLEYVPVHNLDYVPNDFDTIKQWHLFKVDALQAWDQVKGDTNTRLAIVDDAVLLSHEDLSPVIWTNPNEIPGNGIDDDNNGFVDDIHGWDAADNDNDPSPPGTASAGNFSHGTHCAGIAIGRTDNNLGIASLAFNSRLIPVKTKLSSTSGGSLQATLQGVEYAVIIRANVISMSFGSYASSAAWQQLINYANKRNIVFVAAAGNNNTVLPSYPANYNYVISVGATDQNDMKANFSNYGAGTDIMAPGTGIYSCLASGNQDYGYKSGTSMACPLVAGQAALMLSKDSLLTPAEIEHCIKAQADNIDSMNPSFVGNLGAGRLNANLSLQCVKGVYAEFSSNTQFSCPGEIVRFFDKSLRNPTSWHWEFSGGAPSFSFAQNPLVIYNTPGTYKVKLKVSNAKGLDSIEKIDYITIGTPSAMITGSNSVPPGFSVNLRFNLSGTPPFSIKLNDGTSSQWITGINTSPFYYAVTPTVTTTYRLDSMRDANCIGTSNGTAVVTVVPLYSGNCSNPTNSYQKIIRRNGTELSHSLQACVDGGAIWVGTTNSIGSGGDDFYVVRLDDTAKIVWATVLGSSANEAGYSVKVIQTQDSGFAITGYSGGYGASGDDVIFYKLDKNGNIDFDKRIGGGYEEYGRALIQTTDGGYLIGGTTGSLPRAGLQDAYLVKIDDQGNLEWTRKRGFNGITTNHITDFVALPGGNLVGIGAGDHNVTPYASYAIKITQDNTVISERRLTNSLFDAAVSARLLADGSIGVAGAISSNNGSTYDLLIMSLDTNLNINWAKRFSASNQTTWGSALAATSDSGMVINGYFDNGSGGSDIFNLKLSSTGSVEWSRRYGTSSDENVERWTSSIDEMSDGGLIFGLHTEGHNSQNEDLYVVKTDPCGYAGGCFEGNLNMTVTNLSFSSNAINAINNTGGAVNNITSGVNNWTSDLQNNQQTICSSDIILPPGCRLNPQIVSDLYCQGDTSYFTDVSLDSSGNSIVYHTWIVDGADTISGPQQLKYVFNTVGSHSIRLITGSNASPSCYDTTEVNFDITDQFKVSISAPDEVCENDSFSLGIGKTICGAGSMFYYWSPGANFNDSNARNPQVILDQSGYVYLRVVDSLGQESLDSHFVIVKSNCCNTQAIWDVSNPAVCPGDTFHFTNKSLAQPTASFIWYFGSGATPSQFIGKNPPPVTYSSGGLKVVELISSDFCGTDTFESQVLILNKPQHEILSDTLICSPDTLQLGSPGLSSISYTWLPSVGLNDNYLDNPTALIDSTIEYRLRVTDSWSGCSTVDSVTIILEQLDTMLLGIDSLLCAGDTLEVFYSDPGLTAYWSDNFTGNTRYLMDSVTYGVRLSRNGCNVYDTVALHYVDYDVTITGDDFLCKPDTGFYSIDFPVDSARWSTGSESLTGIPYWDSGYVFVETHFFGCSAKDTFRVDKFYEEPFISGSSIWCESDSTELLVTFPGVQLIWNSSLTDTGGVYFARRDGWHYVDAVYRGCSNRDSAFLSRLPQPDVQIRTDTTICDGDEVEVFVPKPVGLNLLWSDGSTDSIRTFSIQDNYIVTLSNFCGAASDTFELKTWECDCNNWFPNAFSPNDDMVNETFKPYLCEVSDYSMQIFNEYGQLVFETTDMEEGWDGYFKGRAAKTGYYLYVVRYKDKRGEEKVRYESFVLMK